ncbi:proton-translocating transhydrogenase family protein, partial [Subtercola lobariae]|uniref:proton-translocating transhydrogenase family protein n=1 Tax=Subtercola lobariae TaxID=1588641 RepID=UPI0016646175
PPAVQVSAAPAAAPASATPVAPAKTVMSRTTKAVLTVVGIAVLFGVIAVAPAPLPQHITVLVLAVVIGFYVIGKVHHALHTPLMSVTNAISGIVVVGAMLQLTIDDPATRVLASVAVLLASINIFGGFAVSRRMLRMFSKD